MSERDNQLYLDDINEAITKIETYTKGMTFPIFQNDTKTIDAVVRNIEIIGEAVRHLPESFRIRYPDIPWNLIVGARNKAIHEYFGVDVVILWKTVQADIPQLKITIQKI
jgi:uncharacterized protein with HEPN domain